MSANRLCIKVLIILFSGFWFSCQVKPQLVAFPVQGTDIPLYGLSREAVNGSLRLSGNAKLEYRFSNAVDFVAPVSFEIEYSFNIPAANRGQWRPVLEAGDYAWMLSAEGDFGGYTPGGLFHYAIPVSGTFPEYFSIAMSNNAGEDTTEKNSAGSLRIHAVEFKRRWFGFYRLRDTSGDHVYASPFVSIGDSGWAIDPPEVFNIPAGLFPVVSAALSPLPDQQPGREPAIETGGRRFVFFPGLEALTVPTGIIAPNDGPFVVSGDNVTSFVVSYTQLPPFPTPIMADPGMVLAWPLERWRDRRYEVFHWEQFPSLLIFDFADYAVQDRMLKRLAFFVEKAGFRGRLPHDAEIADLHGWNAHDYKAEDLARFFQLARNERFPLLAEERELEQILVGAGIIRESGGMIQEGEGGIISISRESPDYLRSRFMAHEGFHGLFFIDEDFRNFSRQRWQQLSAEAKRFITSFFDYQRYDITDEYLLINEFMAHILQQPVSQAGYYFGHTLPSRIETTSWRRADLPAKDAASNSWPTLARAFTREAEAFSAYVGSRWGLAAGRVHQVTVRQP